jgi:hypothetical protein
MENIKFVIENYSLNFIKHSNYDKVSTELKKHEILK